MTINGIKNSGVFTGTAAALGTITNTLGRKITFKIVTSGTETVSISGIIVGTTTTTGKILAKAILTLLPHSTVDMDDGSFYLECIPTDTLVFTGSSTSDTKTVSWVLYD